MVRTPNNQRIYRFFLCLTKCHRLPIAAGLVVAGGAAKLYADTTRESMSLSRQAAQRIDDEREKRNAMLLEVYGSGESLEELEKAVAFYESKK